MSHTLGDAPIQEEYRHQMQAVARGLDEIFNGDAKGAERKAGFVLLVFPFGDAVGARCNFISNGADRRDIVTLMKNETQRIFNEIIQQRGDEHYNAHRRR